MTAKRKKSARSERFMQPVDAIYVVTGPTREQLIAELVEKGADPEEAADMADVLMREYDVAIVPARPRPKRRRPK